jgi:hypothetical protein
MDRGQVQMTSDALRGVQTAVEVFRVISVSLDLNQTLNAVLDGLKSLINYERGLSVDHTTIYRSRAAVCAGIGEKITPSSAADQ